MNPIDSKKLKELFLGGAQELTANTDFINELNVFPVPDGDTGTNMSMTIIAASKEVLADSENTMGSFCHAITAGALKGARGNSGVILSQLFRGFCQAIKEKETLTVKDAVNGFAAATDRAYKAVMKPKEGTILTVARALSEKAEECKEEEDEILFLETVTEAGDAALQNTPNLLPVLKQAGVVDSGGQGLMSFLHGVLDVLKGKEIQLELPSVSQKEDSAKTFSEGVSEEEIRFGYCTEFIVQAKHAGDKEERELKAFLENIGDCVICVADEGVIKIHVHTNHPGQAIEKGLTYGELVNLKIDNMREEHREMIFTGQSTKDREDDLDEKTATPDGFVSISAGSGLSDIFKDLGVNIVLTGGQTMNPSTEDIYKAILKVNAKTVYVLPNNKNIWMAAKQAADLVQNRDVIVIPTTAVTEGIAAMLSYIPGETNEINENKMTEAISGVRTIEVTYAVRSTEINGMKVEKDDFMALSGKEILSSMKNLEECVKISVQKENGKRKAGIITLYFGESVLDEDAHKLAAELAEQEKGTEVTAILGGQPVYSYIIAFED